MKKIVLIICICLCCKNLWAQTINADSLVDVIIARNKTAKVNPPLSIDSSIKALSVVANPLMRTKMFAEIIIGNGGVTAKQMMYAANRLLAITRKEKNLSGEAIATLLLGYTTYNNGDNVGGVKIIFKALQLAQNKGDKTATGLIYNILGVCTTNPAARQHYYQKALQFSRAAGDDLAVGFELGNLYYGYRVEHMPDSALYYTLKSFELAVKKNYEILIAYDLQNLGSLQSNAKVKLKYFRAAYDMPYNRNNPELMERATGTLASYYQESKQTDSALYYARKAYNASNNLLIGRKLKPSALLASLYKGRNADSALKYTEISYALRDSMYNLDKIEHAHAIALVEQQKHEQIAAQKTAYQTNLRLYVLIAVMTCLLVLAFVFWRNNRQNQRAKTKIQQALDELKTTQQQLIQSEKMASLGELTAGIAHEIQNPLNFVNNFSEVNREMLEELKAESTKPKAEQDEQLEIELINDLIANEQKINHHGKRADSIVKGMLEHSRVGTGEKQPTDLNALADEFLKLSYHGLRAKDKAFNAEMITNFDANLPKMIVAQQDIGRVLLNLFNNAFYAVNQRSKTANADYKPTVEVTSFYLPLQGAGGLTVRDNGNGIPDAIKDKIMQPFFTTKPTGEGTGLGLSLSYDIVVKGHGGKIDVKSAEGEGSEFIILLKLD